MYKNKVETPPLLKQDGTLAVSKCGYQTLKVNNFLNTRTNIMGLQFGKDKCVRMHIGKRQNFDICGECKVDAWKDEVITHMDGRHELQDKYAGEDIMKTVHDKKYLGDIISDDMNNHKNIKEKTNRGVGIVKKIIASLIERPYGRHTFKAAKLMREGMLLGSMLTNAESWINMTKKDIEALEKPDTFLQRSILTKTGNPCKVFMYLELGILPIKYVIIEN